MEDPWANAWGEPAKSVDAQNSWSSDPKTSLDAINNETAIAVPSWATGGGRWDEPLEGQSGIPHSDETGNNWDTTDTSFPSRRRSPDPNVDRSRAAEMATHALASAPPSPGKESIHISYNEDFTDSAVLSTAPVSAPSSPDAFGTFETGLTANEADVDPWAQSLPSDTSKERDTWDPSQTPSDSADVVAKVDEWEAAKRQKEKQDRHVPPHILAFIHSELQSLSSDLWPPVSSSQAEEMDDRQRGMIDFESIPITNRLIPQDLTLPPYVTFHKTFTKKHMGDALRLTRHVPLVHSSPFNLYLSSKGSTTWESSVRNRAVVANDDFLPSGWRVLEKGKDETKPEPDVKKTITGGLLSFFGRKPSATSLEDNRRSESPNQELSKSLSVTAVHETTATPSARTSADSSKPHSIKPAESMPPNPPSPSTNLTTSADVAPTSLAESSQPGHEQAPSAVSRFLNRFSRSKAVGPNPHNSLALSTDDIEFLSDTVPSANEEADETLQLRDLTSMLISPPLPTGLPPPLAPPPRAPSPKNFHPSNAKYKQSQITSDNDIISLFDSPAGAGSGQPKLTQSIPPTIPTKLATPLASRSPSRIETRTANLSAYRSGRSSPSNSISSSRKLHASPSGKRTPVAIMSTGSAPSSKVDAFSSLPPPPILPPPPETKSITRETHSRQSSQKSLVDEDFAGFRSFTPSVSSPSLHADTSMSSVFSDQSLISNTSSRNVKINNDLFDDFDEFVSSPIKDPSPPRPPSKPNRQQPLAHPIGGFPPLLAPQPSLPSSNTDNRQYAVNAVTSQVGSWTASQSSSHRPVMTPSNTSDSSVPRLRQTNGGVLELSSPAPLMALPPPSGFNVTMSPQPLPFLQASNSAAKNGQPQQPQAKHTPSVTSVTSGGLSAQDLSFFEGL